MEDLSAQYQIAGELRAANRLRRLALIASIQSDKTLSEEKAELTEKIALSPSKASWWSRRGFL